MHGAGPQITDGDEPARDPGRVRRRPPARRRAPGSRSCASRWPRSTPALCAALGERRRAGLRRRGRAATPSRCRRSAGSATRCRAGRAQILAALAAGKVPVVAPLAVGPLNVNADDAAAALALGLGARPAPLPDRRRRACTSTARSSTRSTSTAATRMLDAGAFEGGIVPKLRAAALAAGSGVAAEIGRTAVVA